MPEAQLHVRSISFTSLREILRTSQHVPELEYGLVRRYGDRLDWGTADKSLLLDMAVQRCEVKYSGMTLDVYVRYFCHSGAATADYDRFSERFNMKRCILVLGNVGESSAPWAELIQPALDLYQREYNLLWVDIPAFKTNTGRWLKYGPSVMRGVLRFLAVKAVHVLACGVGGSIFMEMLGQGPSCLAKTHFIYNMDFPKGSKQAPFDVNQLEDSLRDNPVQMWFAYCDTPEDEDADEPDPEPKGYNRRVDGTPRRAYEVVNQIAARLQGERRRAGKGDDKGVVVNFDEVLITEKLNLGRRECIREEELGRTTCVVASQVLLISLFTYFAQPPTARLDDLRHGLIMDLRARVRATDEEEPDALPALSRLRAGPDRHERVHAAAANKRRSELMASATLCLAPGAELERLRIVSRGILDQPVKQDNVLHGLRALHEMQRKDSDPRILTKRQEYVKVYQDQRAVALHGFGANYGQQ